MSTKVDENHAMSQARAQLDTVIELMALLEQAQDTGDEVTYCDYQYDEDGIRDLISENALSVEVRTDWDSVGGSTGNKPTHYRILLCTGGPACQISGSLSEHMEPDSAIIEYQDWGTPWTDLDIPYSEQEILQAYAETFYFGE